MDKNKLELFKNVFSFIQNLGFDVIVIFGIATITELIKRILRKMKKIKPSDKDTPKVICFICGLMAGLIQIGISIFVKKPIPFENWLRILLGYPFLSIAVYGLLFKIIFEKIFNRKKNGTK